MSIYDFGEQFAQEYKSKCVRCGKELFVSTQKDENPEYYTTVHVKCDCGGSAEFVIPVN